MTAILTELALVFGLGFLGSFGHCAGMCGPLTVAFSLSHQHQTEASPDHLLQQIKFHAFLNLGRLLSYTLIGGIIGGIGSVVVASGQMAGIGSEFRQLMALITGTLLIWLGLTQVAPNFLPKMPILNPMGWEKLSHTLQGALAQQSRHGHLWTPMILGLGWGLIPCGFLYTAQLKAAATGDLKLGALTMFAFGLGTFPTMLGVGYLSLRFSSDRRSQLFRLGGWLTLIIGILTLQRTGDAMVDYAGYGSLICLILALIARPLHRLYPHFLPYRRALGVGSFILALVHIVHRLEHNWGWNFQAFSFMLPQHQAGVKAGAIAFFFLMPLALTSFDQAQKQLGRHWRSLHLLSLPALIAVTLHCLLTGATFFGQLRLTWMNYGYSLVLCILVLAVFLLRSHWFWRCCQLEKFYSTTPKAEGRKKTAEVE